jgi:hypothetical protein
MFSNEFEFDEIVTVVMDDFGNYEDVHVIITDDQVFIRQWDDAREKYEVVFMSPKMFYELQEAMKKPTGFYKLEIANTELVRKVKDGRRK